MTRVHCTRRCSTGQTWSTVDARHSKGREEGARTILAPQLVSYPPERSGLDSGSLPWRIDERRERRGGESRLVVVCARREGHRGARSARARLRRALRLLSITATCARRVASSAALRLRLGWSRRRGWLRPASAASPQPPHVVDDRPHDCPTRPEHCARRGHRVRPMWLLAARGSAHNKRRVERKQH